MRQKAAAYMGASPGYGEMYTKKEKVSMTGDYNTTSRIDRQPV